MFDLGKDLAEKLSTENLVVFRADQVLDPAPCVNVVCGGVLRWRRRGQEKGAAASACSSANR